MVQYYWNPGYQQPMQPPMQQPMTPPGIPAASRPQQPPSQEESYIENILRLNKGKVATLYFTFANNREWNAKVITGVVEAAGRDHVIVSDTKTGKRYLMLLIYLDYITFDEEINYFQ